MSPRSVRTRATSARVRVLVVACGAAAVLAGCGGTPTVVAIPVEAAPSPAPSTAPSPAPAPAGAASQRSSASLVVPGTDRNGGAAVVAKLRGATGVHASPHDARVERTLVPRTEFGSPTVVPVVEVGTGPNAGWLEVPLATGGGRATGWIRRAGVELRRTALAVHVDLAARTLTVTDRDETVLSARAAVGATGWETPSGRFHVVDKLTAPDPRGAAGPYTLVLAPSRDLAMGECGVGPRVAIHGTDAPGSIGTAVPEPCVRVDNEVVDRLAHLLPLGAPVTIS